VGEVGPPGGGDAGPADAASDEGPRPAQDAAAARREARRATLAWLKAWATLLLAVLVVAGAVFSLVWARLFLWPPSDPPAKVDAIVALGGDPNQARAAEAVRLAQQGWSHTVLVSLGGFVAAPCPKRPPGIDLTCFRADPLNTRGEMEYAARAAAAHHWTSLMIVPGRTQATRARLLFRRCSQARLVVVPVSDHGYHLLFDVAYETAALLKAYVVHRSC
jgi:uncharacterized SAM-binding protein YcdF (DUF218 family)